MLARLITPVISVCMMLAAIHVIFLFLASFFIYSTTLPLHPQHTTTTTMTTTSAPTKPTLLALPDELRDMIYTSVSPLPPFLPPSPIR